MVNRVSRMEGRLRDHDWKGHHRRSLRETWSNGQYRGCLGGGSGFDHTAPVGSLLAGDLSWPPRSYTCSFCKREFRSAQALGGHMNVHRRDRARLRESPPWELPGSNILDPSPSLRPNPSPSSMSNPGSLPTLNHELDPKLDDLHFASPLSVAGDRTRMITRQFPPLQLPSSVRLSSSPWSRTLPESPPSSSSELHQAKSRWITSALYGVGQMTGRLTGSDDQVMMSNVLGRKVAVKELSLEFGVRGDVQELDLELRLGSA